MQIAQPLTFIDLVRPQHRSRRMLCDAGLMIAGSLLIAICAQMRYYIGAIPITGQTFAVLLIGALYGWRLGMATVMLYIFEGLIGLPVFAGLGAGPMVLAGATGGYLMAFVPAAGVTGWLASRGWDRRFLTTLAAMTIGTTIIFIGGLTQLAILMAASGSLDVTALLAAGLWPFLPGGAVKILMAAFLLPSGWTILRALRG